MRTYIETSRLILRDWKVEDLSLFAGINADPNVMEYFLKPLTVNETFAFYERIQDELNNYGYGLFAVERKEDSCFIGYTGLHRFTFEADFSPNVEIGWRLAANYWGHGYAPEAAAACLEFAKQSGLNEVYSFTSLQNVRSQRVMQKIEMNLIKEFDHPLVPKDHPLLKHILYCKRF